MGRRPRIDGIDCFLWTFAVWRITFLGTWTLAGPSSWAASRDDYAGSQVAAAARPLTFTAFGALSRPAFCAMPSTTSPLASRRPLSRARHCRAISLHCLARRQLSTCTWLLLTARFCLCQQERQPRLKRVIPLEYVILQGSSLPRSDWCCTALRTADAAQHMRRRTRSRLPSLVLRWLSGRLFACGIPLLKFVEQRCA